jgi:hypothetical protein
MIQLDERLGDTPRYFMTKEPRKLMLVPDHVRDCVVFVGYEKSHGAFEPLGTGFLVARPIEGTGNRENAAYCVTAKHVIDDVKKCSAAKVLLRMNLTGKGAECIETEWADWVYHPGGGVVDVAVIPIEFELGIHDHGACPLSMSLDSSKIAKEAIGIGDELFVVGLFSQHIGTQRNIPILRVGNIAAMPDEAVDTSMGPMQAYLAEARSTGGLSGSPVFVHLGAVRVTEGKLKIAQTTNPKFFLLGLMHGHWRTSESPSTDLLSRNANVNMGIAIVVPVEKILEVLNQDVIRDLERKKAEVWREKNLPVMD